MPLKWSFRLRNLKKFEIWGFLEKKMGFFEKVLASFKNCQTWLIFSRNLFKCYFWLRVLKTLKICCFLEKNACFFSAKVLGSFRKSIGFWKPIIFYRKSPLKVSKALNMVKFSYIAFRSSILLKISQNVQNLQFFGKLDLFFEKT